MTADRRRAWITATLAVAAAMPAGCTAGDGGDRPRPTGSVEVSTEQRLELRAVGSDTLSDSARVTGVFPEADGDAVAFTFADPQRRVSAGLAITQRAAPGAALLWPDSVTAVWWSAPHALAFTTESGEGVRAVVDIHAANATVTTDPAQRAPARPAPPNRADPTFQRAVRYIDSARVQPAGRPQGSSLRYEVVSLRGAPGGRLAAFYTVATDSAGGRTNPAWYAVDAETGAVARIDEIVGPVAEMPEGAAGWTTDGHFVYAKGEAIWQAAVRTRR